MSTALADPARSSGPIVLPTEEFPIPTRSDEAWRFATLSHLEAAERLVPAEPVDEAEIGELLERSQGLSDAAARFVFVNGRLVASECRNLPEGVLVGPLEEAREGEPDLFARHFMKEEVLLGSARYAALHRANTRAGVFVHVPRGVVIEHPIEVFHWMKGSAPGSDRPAGLFPHTLVVAEENAQATVVDHFVSADPESEGFSVGVCDFSAAAGAHITYVNAQRWNLASRGIQICSTAADRDAQVKSVFLNLGGRWVRNEATSHLNGPGGNSDMLSVSIAAGGQEFDQRTLQLHHAPDTTSDLLYKNALYDKGRTIFAGLIVVDEGAHRTDAYQKCRNLLMSDDAEATSMPGLEINADQVKCSHGATTGRIDEEQLFYLMSRGIPDGVARELITIGFTQEVVARTGCPELAGTLESLIAEKFRRLA